MPPRLGRTTKRAWSPRTSTSSFFAGPCVDGGRDPVKGVVGDTRAIGLDDVADGHDKLRAVVLDRAQDRTEWRETELVLAADDTWRAMIDLPALGRHIYTCVAW